MSGGFMGRFIEFSPPDISQLEIDEVVAVLRSGWITTGAKAKEFEQLLAAFCGTEHVACVNSATAALELTLRVLGIGRGDEVITSAYTYTASASVILHVGATPVLVDTAPDSYHLDCERVKSAISERTKAVIGVDVAGIMCDYAKIIDAARGGAGAFHPNCALQEAMGRIAVIADAAHSLGAEYDGKKSGAAADFSAFSFHAVKNLTTAEGGAATWRAIDGVDSGELYRQYRLLSLHGQSKDAYEKARRGGWEYDVVTPGYKCNLPDVLAAIGVAQLGRYPALLARRRGLAGLYTGLLRDERFLLPQHLTARAQSSVHLYPVRLAGRDEAYRNRVIERMAELGVAANVHYKPLPMLTAYKQLGYDIADYPNAFAQYKNELTLPLYTLLSDEEAAYVAHSFITACE